jgi:hypothetical protein
MPGEIALTVIPAGPNSDARQRVKVAKAAFATAYAVHFGVGSPSDT